MVGVDNYLLVVDRRSQDEACLMVSLRISRVPGSDGPSRRVMIVCLIMVRVSIFRLIYGFARIPVERRLLNSVCRSVENAAIQATCRAALAKSSKMTMAPLGPRPNVHRRALTSHPADAWYPAPLLPLAALV